ncbi:MAG TPA: secondary thiamine-phosphate synthase enzyme YjbQ [Planctomycetota bacterium]|nr:secondary thiamine-phosphate synthase enzyme YjbQ [Planctomycetota bacterium]
MHKLEVSTRAHSEFHEITDEVQALVAKAKISSGLAHVYVPHTTAGLTINENADPDVKADMLKSLEQMVPWNQPHFQHAEGNSAAHIKASMMGFNITVFIENGSLALGMWQGIYLCEFDGPRTRQVWVKLVSGS